MYSTASSATLSARARSQSGTSSAAYRAELWWQSSRHSSLRARDRYDLTAPRDEVPTHIADTLPKRAVVCRVALATCASELLDVFSTVGWTR